MTQASTTDSASLRGDLRAEPAVASGALLVRVPGRARSRAQARKSFDESVAVMRQRYKPAFWPLFAPEAGDIYRWRVELECGCIHEVFTCGENDYPDEHSWTDLISDRKLPAGEYWCSNDHGVDGRAYRDIVEWCERHVTEFPPDPEESPYEGMDPETWGKIRQTEPHSPHSSAVWRVKLSCGHFNDHVVTEVDWKPVDGPTLCTVQRTAVMRRELEAIWSEEGHVGWPEEGIERDHLRKMLDLRWPLPEPEQDCFTCRYAMRMTGYQRIGWLVPREKPTETPDPEVERNKAKAKLAKLEAEARQLREQLGLAPEG